MGRHPDLPRRVAAPLAGQKGRCAACGLSFSVDGSPEVDHIVPLTLGGTEGSTSWQLLHRQCHDDKTTRDGSVATWQALTCDAFSPDSLRPARISRYVPRRRSRRATLLGVRVR